MVRKREGSSSPRPTIHPHGAISGAGQHLHAYRKGQLRRSVAVPLVVVVTAVVAVMVRLVLRRLVLRLRGGNRW